MFGLIPFILNVANRRSDASARRDRRALLVSFDEGVFPAVGMTREGCRLIGYFGSKKNGDVFKINAIRTLGGDTARPFIVARVLGKCWRRRELVLGFESVSESSHEIIDGLVEQRLRDQCAERLKRNAGDRPIPGWMKPRPDGA